MQSKPCLGPAFSFKEAEAELKSALGEPFEIESRSAELRPCYFFSVIIYYSEKGVVSSHKKLELGFDSINGSFTEFSARPAFNVFDCSDFEKDQIKNPEPLIGLKEAEKTLKIMLSEKYNASLQNIEILNCTEYCNIFYYLRLKAPEEREIAVDLSNGKILSRLPDPKFSFVLRETLADLKYPKKWLFYSSDAVKSTANQAGWLSRVSPKTFLEALILLLMVFLILLFFLG